MDQEGKLETCPSDKTGLSRQPTLPYMGYSSEEVRLQNLLKTADHKTHMNTKRHF